MKAVSAYVGTAFFIAKCKRKNHRFFRDSLKTLLRFAPASGVAP
ncbi:hypothetical protein [Treponema sp.]|nr:hypothetical protein [Treponema sp.]